jgi:acetoin utilization deacetylase AcuC-like enzyme
MLKVAYSPVYHVPLPDGHRFPMEKYELLPQQLLYEGVVNQSQFFMPQPLDEKTILLTHSPDYVQRMLTLTLSAKEIREIGFPVNEQFVNRTRAIAHATIQVAQYALQYGCAFNAAGGTHHSFTNKGGGYCLFNDVAIACNYLLLQKTVQRILIVDLDVHQGDGTAEIFRENPKVFTFSMHGADNYPLRKEISDLDIGLATGCDDTTYLNILKETLPRLIQTIQPDLIFYLAGVDVLATDKLGKLSLSQEGCRLRDRYVFEQCKLNHIPVAVTMAGGYSERIAHIVDAHTNTYKMATDVFF